MSFYIIKQDTLIDGSRSLDGVPEVIQPLEWMKGKPMADPSPGKKLVFELSQESGNYNGDIIDGILTLYSDEIKVALENFGIDNVEFYAVGLHDQNTNTFEGGYWIANIVGLLSCIDMEKSRTKPWVSGIGFDFLSMVIDASKTNDLKIFRLKEDPTKVIIREDLKKHLETVGAIVGVKFIKTEDYSDW